MDTLQWRPRAKIVAIVQMVFISIICLMVTPLIVGSLIWSPRELFYSMIESLGGTDLVGTLENMMLSPYPDRDIEELRSSFNTFLWILFVLWAIITFIDVVALPKLWNSVRPTCERKVAAGNARCWRNVRVVHLVIGVLLFIMIMLGRNEDIYIILKLMLGVNVLYEVGRIGVVQKFINEMGPITSAPAN